MKRPFNASRQPAGSFTTAALLGALALTSSFTSADAQESEEGNKGRALEVFEAAQQAPPEHAELERAMKGLPAAPARARPGVDELVAQVARQHGGKERLERARKGGRPEHAIKASQRPPPGVTKAEKQTPPAPPRSKRPTRQELEQVISRQPGGREKLDRARKGGRPDRAPPKTSATERLAEWFAWLPDVISSAHAAGELSVTLTPQVGSGGAHGGLAARSAAGSDGLYASVVIRGAHVTSGTPRNSYVAGLPYQINWDANTRSETRRPFVRLRVIAPRDGYYIINTRAWSSTGVQLRRYQYPDYPLVQTFDASGTADRPALVYLTKGYHHFYWVSPGYLYLYSASVDSYP